MSRLDKPIFLQFGSWTPDIPEWQNTGALTASGVLPYGTYYKPMQKPVDFADALSSAVLGAIACQKSSDASVANFVGTATDIYEQNALTWTSVTNVGGPYTITSPDRWEFVQYGEVAIGVNGWTDPPQSITIGNANFADLAGSPPSARHIAIVQNFVVLGNTNDSIDGARTQRLWWSGFNDAAYWTPGLARQCSFRDLVGDGGRVQRVIGGDYGLVLRERSLVRMSYVGPPGVFQLDDIADSHGTDTPYSAVKWGAWTFYHSADGWYVYDGQTSTSIGRGIIDETFKRDFQAAYPNNLIGSTDPLTKMIHWIYPGAGSVGGIPNRDLIFNPVTRKFTLINIENEFLGPMYSSLPTDIDSVDAIYANTDSPDGFLDDPAFAGGNLQLGFFRPTHRLAFATGLNHPVVIDTGERRFNPMGRAFIEGLQPMIDTSTGVTLTMLERDRVSDPITTGESDSLDSEGEAHPRSDARFHRIRMTVAEDTDWSKTDGIYVTEMASGGVR